MTHTIPLLNFTKSAPVFTAFLCVSFRPMDEGCWDNGREVCSPRVCLAWQNTLGIGQEPNIRRAGNTVCTSPHGGNKRGIWRGVVSQTFVGFNTESWSYFAFSIVEICLEMNVKWELVLGNWIWNLLSGTSHICRFNAFCRIEEGFAKAK